MSREGGRQTGDRTPSCQSVLENDLCVRAGRYLFVALALQIASGCGRSFDHSAWIQRRGGLVQDMELQSRLDDCLNRLSACLGVRLRLYVLDSPAVTAHAWSNGTIYLTRGIVAAMDDQQLAAVVAHEVGHLLDNDHLLAASQWSLQGQPPQLDTEARADWIGCQLLVAQGLPPDAMIRALERVHLCDGLTTRKYETIGRRIELLQSTFGAIPTDSIPVVSDLPSMQH